MRIELNHLIEFSQPDIPINVRKLQLLTTEESDRLRSRLILELELIHQEYFYDMSTSEFEQKYLFHESVVMKCATHRVFDNDLFSLIRTRIENIFFQDSSYKELKFDFHPVFYARITKSNVIVDYRRLHAALDSQPHFDRTYNTNALSFWVALERIGQETGGLCFFNPTPEIKSTFRIKKNSLNRFNMNLYLDNYKTIDSLLVNHIIHPDINSGEAYLFDSTILHGATKPINKMRVSFDFRIITEDRGSKNLERDTITEVFNRHIDLSNAMNLLYLGDSAGASVLYPEIYEIIRERRLKLPSDLQSLRYQPTSISWRTEYEWIRRNSDVLAGNF